MKLKEGQVWFNAETGKIYEIKSAHETWEGEVFVAATFDDSFLISDIIRHFVKNPINNWHYIGEL